MEDLQQNMEVLAVPDRRPWYWWIKLITVEPTMTLYMFAFMTTSVIEQDFFLRRTCLVNHGYPEEICYDLENNDEINKEVQKTVSDFHQWNNIAGHIFPIVLAMFLGAWSDKRGRKFPLLMGLFGKLIYSIMLIVNMKQDSWPVEYVIWTATIPCALTGADVAIFASCFAYVSDVSSVNNRTMRVTILDVCYLAAMPSGVAFGKFLFYEVFGRAYWSLFAVNAGLIGLAIIYSIIVLKWQTTPKQRSLKELGACGIWKDYFDRKHVVESVKTVTKKREGNRRLFLGILMLSMALYTFQRDEKPFLYLYTNRTFQWGVGQYSDFKTALSAAYCIVMLCAVPLMTKTLKFRDTTIVLIGSTAHATARIIYIFAPTTLIFYIGSAVCSIGPIVGPVLRSMTSKIVPISERGKVFALLSVCDNAVPFISGVLYAQVNKATIGKIGGIFWLTFATQATVFMLILIIHIRLGRNNLAVPEIEKGENLLTEENSREVQIVPAIKPEETKENGKY